MLLSFKDSEPVLGIQIDTKLLSEEKYRYQSAPGDTRVMVSSKSEKCLQENTLKMPFTHMHFVIEEQVKIAFLIGLMQNRQSTLVPLQHTASEQGFILRACVISVKQIGLFMCLKLSTG